MKAIITFITLSLLMGCSIASISHLERRAADIDFNVIEKEHDDSGGFIWTWKGKNEYFLYAEKRKGLNIREELKMAAAFNGYLIEYVSDDGNAILGKRGIRLNEWNSVIGIYLSEDEQYDRIYIKVEITQDITGGWMSNRAKSIGEYFCEHTKACILKIPPKI